ncbi:MAG TPA: hypothetical protein VK059_08355 [Nocardioidaceae bacterium]|nr:hypothetical protein [Nocardioidaceae bacterium]
MPETPKPSFDDIMRNVQATGGARATSSLTVCFVPAISQQLQELEFELAEAREREQDNRLTRRDPDSDRSSSHRVGDDGPSSVEELEAKRDALIADNEGAFYDLQFQAARRDEWSDLKAMHPPKDDVAEDERMGVHWKSFVPAVVKKCLTDPEPSDKVLDFLAESLTSGEWDRIGVAVIRLNNTVRDRPKSLRNTYMTMINGDDFE